MARAVLSVSVDFELATRLRDLAQQLQATESSIVSEALRCYFSQRDEEQESISPKTQAEAGDARCHV